LHHAGIANNMRHGDAPAVRVSCQPEPVMLPPTTDAPVPITVDVMWMRLAGDASVVDEQTKRWLAGEERPSLRAVAQRFLETYDVVVAHRIVALPSSIAAALDDVREDYARNADGRLPASLTRLAALTRRLVKRRGPSPGNDPGGPLAAQMNLGAKQP